MAPHLLPEEHSHGVVDLSLREGVDTGTEGGLRGQYARDLALPLRDLEEGFQMEFLAKGYLCLSVSSVQQEKRGAGLQ